MSVARYTFGGLDITERVIGDVRVSLGRSIPGSIKSELRAGLCELDIDNSDGFYTRGRGSLFLVAGSPLDVRVDTKPLLLGTPLTGYNANRRGGYSVIQAQFTHTLYRLTSSEDVKINLIAGQRNAVIADLVRQIAPGVTLTFDKPNDDAIIVKADNAYDALISLLQTERKIIRETPVYGELELISEPTGPRFHWYDNDGYEHVDATKVT